MTASVVGVVLNLAIWFALHVLFGQVRALRYGPLTLDTPWMQSVDVAAVALSLLAAIALFRFKMGVIPVLLACAMLGIALHLAGVA